MRSDSETNMFSLRWPESRVKSYMRSRVSSESGLWMSAFAIRKAVKEKWWDDITGLFYSFSCLKLPAFCFLSMLFAMPECRPSAVRSGFELRSEDPPEWYRWSAGYKSAHGLRSDHGHRSCTGDCNAADRGIVAEAMASPHHFLFLHRKSDCLPE